jgi:phosphotriesterase-related protein
VSLSRRSFLITGLALLGCRGLTKLPYVVTVNGPIDTGQLGTALIHEHFLVDFIGADKINFGRWDRKLVVEKVLPYLLEVKQLGVTSIFDCTPAYLGRDVQLLKMLSDASGLHIITNTGYYGAVENKYLPAWAFTESPEQLADRWINEFNDGIEGTSIKPGFIKISVNPDDPLSQVDKKLVVAAALTHKITGLTICSHTGPAPAAFAQLDILEGQGVSPEAFVWVHAQAEKDKLLLVKAAASGAWISLDGLGWGDFDKYADSILLMKRKGLLHRVLISHDAGWYKPDEKEGGEFIGYTAIFKELIPRLSALGFTGPETETLLVQNPAAALGIRVRKI